jgi:2,4-diaminopentanoate dehydrogenase
MTVRVVHWGTGATGALALRGILQHPDLELVGLYVHSAEKAGRDAAELCGLTEPTGVLATSDAAALLALGADCLSYSGPGRSPTAIADVLPFLEAGIDVVTTSFSGLTHPPAAEPELRDPAEAAALAGGASFFSTGIEPGYASDLLPLALLTACDDVHSVRIQEVADYSHYPGADALRIGFGFGEAPGYPAALADPARLVGGWRGVVQLVGDALGVSFDSVEATYERRSLDRDVDTAIGVIAAGTTAAVRFEVQGMVDGVPFVVLEHVNRMAADAAPDWPHARLGDRLVYRTEVTGRPGFACELAFDEPQSEFGRIATAMRAVNAIPAVVAAAPGLLSATDLPATVSRNSRPGGRAVPARS